MPAELEPDGSAVFVFGLLVAGAAALAVLWAPVERALQRRRLRVWTAARPAEGVADGHRG